MRVALLAASTASRGTPSRNQAATQVLTTSLRGDQDGTTLFVTPAGYWAVDRPEDLDPFLDELARTIRHHISGEACVLGGVDVGLPPHSKRACDSLVRSGELPFFGFRFAGKLMHGPWRQASTNNENAEIAPAEPIIAVKDRVFDFGGKAVIPLLCGEMHNKRIRAVVGETDPQVVAVSGHAGLGQGLVPSLHSVQRQTTGACVVHVQHLAPETSGKVHWITRRGVHLDDAVRTDGRDTQGFWTSQHHVTVR